MTSTYLIAHGSKAVQAARIIAAVNNQSRPTVAPQQWRIEVLNKDGTHHSFVPRFGRGDITAERALECLNETLDHERFTARVV